MTAIARTVSQPKVESVGDACAHTENPGVLPVAVQTAQWTVVNIPSALTHYFILLINSHSAFRHVFLLVMITGRDALFQSIQLLFD